MTCSSAAALGVPLGALLMGASGSMRSPASPERVPEPRAAGSGLVTLFLCGDVMTGRGVDQVLPHPGDPRLEERYVRSALGYVELAERANGPVERPVEFSYPWGDALEEFDRVRPDARIVNLETSVTRSDDFAPKGIHYRMHPDNVPCLTAARIDCCALANNHVFDFGRSGLVETLEILWGAGLRTAGAGRNREEAEAPAILEIPGKGRVVVFSFGSPTSGIPRGWAASPAAPGVSLLDETTVRRIAAAIRDVRRPGDVAVASIHWGGNWGYEVPRAQRDLAHALIDEAGVDVVHGHSSHHAKGIELHAGKPILYGCGDFLTDYEGIRGYEEFRGDLALMYFVTMDPESRQLVRLEMTPLRMRRFRLERAPREDAEWLRAVLDREGAKLGTRVEATGRDRLRLGWGS